jgi:hypothetical protein
VRKLHNPRITIVDYDNESGACRQHRFFVVLPPPIWVQLRHPFRIEVDRKDFGKFFDTKWADRSCQALQQSMRVLSVWLFDLPQYALVCVI